MQPTILIMLSIFHQALTIVVAVTSTKPDERTIPILFSSTIQIYIAMLQEYTDCVLLRH